jgi:ribosomal protein S18 acetylase RimI-like enzyme
LSYHLEFVERFAEPDFSQLAHSVFRELEEPSEALAVVRREEALGAQRRAEATQQPKMLRCGAFEGGRLIAWSYGSVERSDVFYMANSGVDPAYRRRGIYSELVNAMLGRTRAMGLSAVRSRHLCSNNAVLIAKLKLGFHVTGFEFSEEFGPLVCLSFLHGEARSALFRQRARALGMP